MTWPRIRVEWYDPARPREIVSVEEAQERFGLDAGSVESMRKEYLAGTGIRRDLDFERYPEAKNVRTLWRYTELDCAKDHVIDLVDAVEEVLKAWEGVECDTEEQTNAILKARRTLRRARGVL